jgi:CRISPR system Cascade subunit CasE
VSDAEVVHLVKVPLRPDKLALAARRRGIPLRDLDEGYLVHCILREIWQSLAPAPFVLRMSARCLDAWGYAGVPSDALAEHARAFADPALLAIIDGLDQISSKEIPLFHVGRRVGFILRASPVVRLAKDRGPLRAGAEVDAFLARCLDVGPDVEVSREDVYGDWLVKRFGDPASAGARIQRVRVAAFSRDRIVRRTQGEPGTRNARRLERPDVRFEGEVVVNDGQQFRRYVRRGVGRHRAFGFGALILVPPGTSYPRPGE